jgi:hypothetical protein
MHLRRPPRDDSLDDEVVRPALFDLYKCFFGLLGENIIATRGIQNHQTIGQVSELVQGFLPHTRVFYDGSVLHLEADFRARLKAVLDAQASTSVSSRPYLNILASFAFKRTVHMVAVRLLHDATFVADSFPEETANFRDKMLNALAAECCSLS